MIKQLQRSFALTRLYGPTTLKATIWEYLSFCMAHDDFDLVVSLDGSDEETISFCRHFHIPLLWSAEREGVGIAKNRVIKSYPDYEFYFFIEDDAFLLNPAVFELHIEVAKEVGIHHLSLGPRDRFVNRLGNLSTNHGAVVGYAYGSALFNFFTGKGLRLVGGFHPMFASLRRFGHTEHTYRFVTQRLSAYPFCVIEDCLEGYVHAYSPRSVTKLNVEKTTDRLYVGERRLMDERLDYVPVTTPSPYTCPADLVLQNVQIPRFRARYVAPFKFRMGLLDGARAVKGPFFVN